MVEGEDEESEEMVRVSWKSLQWREIKHSGAGMRDANEAAEKLGQPQVSAQQVGECQAGRTRRRQGGVGGGERGGEGVQGLESYLMQVGGTAADFKAKTSDIVAPLLQHVGSGPDVAPRMVPPVPPKYAFASAQPEGSLVTQSRCFACLILLPYDKILKCNRYTELQLCRSAEHLRSEWLCAGRCASFP